MTPDALAWTVLGVAPPGEATSSPRIGSVAAILVGIVGSALSPGG